MKFKINEDKFYSTTDSVFSYYIENQGAKIFEGKAYKSPDKSTIDINITKICRDWVKNRLPDFREYEDNIISQYDAYQSFDLYKYTVVHHTGETEYDEVVPVYVDTYNVLYDWDYEEAWTGQSKTLSNPVNGRMDSRMKLLYTVYRLTEDEAICPDIRVIPIVQYYPSSIVFNAYGGTKQFTVISNVPYTLRTATDWITIEGTADIGTTVFNIIAEELSGDEERSGSLTLRYYDENNHLVTATINIVQKEISLWVEPTEITLYDDSGTTTITVHSSGSFAASTAQDWLRLSATGGSAGTTVITVSYEENEGLIRTGNVAFVGEDGTICYTNILQKAQGNYRQIMYKTSDEQIITVRTRNCDGGNYTNVYENGWGLITYEYPLTRIGGRTSYADEPAYSDYRPIIVYEPTLTEIYFPDDLQFIGFEHLELCYELKILDIPESIKMMEGMGGYPTEFSEHLPRYGGWIYTNDYSIALCNDERDMRSGVVFHPNTKMIAKFAYSDGTTQHNPGILLPKNLILPEGIEKIGILNTAEGVTRMELPSTMKITGDEFLPQQELLHSDYTFEILHSKAQNCPKGYKWTYGGYVDSGSWSENTANTISTSIGYGFFSYPYGSDASYVNWINKLRNRHWNCYPTKVTDLSSYFKDLSVNSETQFTVTAVSNSNEGYSVRAVDKSGNTISDGISFNPGIGHIGETEFTVTVQPHTSRDFYILFDGTVMKLSQRYSLTVPELETISYSANSITIRVTSDSPVSATTDTEWITADLEPYYHYGNYYDFSVGFERNEGAARTGTVIFYTETETGTTQIVQKSMYDLTVSPSAITVNSGATSGIWLTARSVLTPISARTDDNWITLRKSGNDFEVKASQNGTIYQRTGNIIVYNPSASTSVLVTQSAGTAYARVTDTTRYLSSLGGQMTIPVVTNYDYPFSVVSGSDWFTVTKVNDDLIGTYSENSGSSYREAKVKINNITVTVRQYQYGFAPTNQIIYEGYSAEVATSGWLDINGNELSIISQQTVSGKKVITFNGDYVTIPTNCLVPSYGSVERVIISPNVKIINNNPLDYSGLGYIKAIPSTITNIGTYGLGKIELFGLYEGTKAQWNSIIKDARITYYGNIPIHCKDGVINVS